MIFIKKNSNQSDQIAKKTQYDINDRFYIQAQLLCQWGPRCPSQSGPGPRLSSLFYWGCKTVVRCCPGPSPQWPAVGPSSLCPSEGRGGGLVAIWQMSVDSHEMMSSFSFHETDETFFYSYKAIPLFRRRPNVKLARVFDDMSCPSLVSGVDSTNITRGHIQGRSLSWL